MIITEGHAIDLIESWRPNSIDLVVTDPPYAFGGAGTEHAVSATVATALRETAKKLRQGSWMIVLCASSWRSISYMTEAVRGILDPVRVATWGKPESKTKVRTPGWDWSLVAAIAMRKGAKNRKDLVQPPGVLDHIEARTITNGRRAQLPEEVAMWAVAPFVVPGGTFLDPFAGSGALPRSAEQLGMDAYGFEIQPVTISGHVGRRDGLRVR